jgi:hypothetical protein
VRAKTPGFPFFLAPSDAFGASVAGIGDVDGDGVPDLAVGAYMDKEFQPGGGAVYILLLQRPAGAALAARGLVPGGNSPVKVTVKITPGTRGFGDTSLQANAYFGASVAGFRDLDTNFVYSANLWWEPLQEFGGLYSDLSYHETLATRGGGSVTMSRQSGSQFDSSEPEESFIRLSDGTDLTQPGALAPGVSVTDYMIYLATYDAGIKYRGLSLHGEYFLRWLSDIKGTGPIPDERRELFDHGFHIQAGAFVVPKRLELFTRTSHIFGPFGDGAEYSGGFNWFIRGTENWRFGGDITQVINSPAQQLRTGYDAGASGTLVRSQLQTIF